MDLQTDKPDHDAGVKSIEVVRGMPHFIQSTSQAVSAPYPPYPGECVSPPVYLHSPSLQSTQDDALLKEKFLKFSLVPPTLSSDAELLAMAPIVFINPYQVLNTN